MRLALALLVLTGLAAPSAAGPGAPPDRSHAIAVQSVAALGPAAAWDSLTGLRWTYGRRQGDDITQAHHHTWNRRTGQHRVEGTARNGLRFVFIHTVGDTTTGIALMNGVRIPDGDSLRWLMARAQSMWVNDSPWLLLPHRLLEAGVQRAYDGEASIDGRMTDRLALTFADDHEHAGERNWVYIDRDSHRIVRWEYVRRGTTPPPVTWDMGGWEQHDGLWFPTTHRQGAVTLVTTRIETVHAFPESTFLAP